MDNIVFNSYAHNFHGYAEKTALNNLHLEGNISFNAAAYTNYGGREYLIGGVPAVQNLNFRSNYLYRAYPNSAGLNPGEARFGLYADNPNPDGSVVTDNYLYGKVVFAGSWQGGDFQRNSVLTPAGDGINLSVQASGNFANFTWNNNVYRHNWVPDIYQPFYLGIAGVANFINFSTWKSQTGFDAASTFTTAAPTGQHIVVRRNQYEAKRAHVVVYNYSGAATAIVDLSNVLQPGDEFDVREVQNYFGTPALSGTYAGGTVALPMVAVTAPPPLGAIDFPALSTGTTFHAFVVLRK
jgi:hypothetical protein